MNTQEDCAPCPATGNFAHAQKTNSYCLFIDDIRSPPNAEWVVARSSAKALEIVRARGMPLVISFDHDLGGEDTTMRFLRELSREWGVTVDVPAPPKFEIHSMNFVGAENIAAFMRTWATVYFHPGLRS